jgi:serine/threonine-protein kinase RsbW
MVTRRETLNESYPAGVESIQLARDAVAAFAASRGATKEELDALRLVTSEAVTNVVRHAYDGVPGRIYLTVGISFGDLWIRVRDDGCGPNASSSRPGLGFGLPLIAQLTDDFSIAPRSRGGTEVRIRLTLGAAVPTRNGSGVAMALDQHVEEYAAVPSPACGSSTSPSAVERTTAPRWTTYQTPRQEIIDAIPNERIAPSC